MNPDDKPRRMGAHVYTVEALDLSAHGMPGFAFTGDLHIEPDDTPGVEGEWLIEDIRAPDGSSPITGYPYIAAAVLADARLCDFITEASYEHGEG